jgi:hypothetical protein
MNNSALDWYKASFCQTGECVEVAAYNDVVLMRNSAQPESGYVYFTPQEFNGFLVALKSGEFDLAG